MRRREFLRIAAGTPFSLAARAAEPQHVVGFLTGTSVESNPTGWWAAFLRGLHDTGFVEGRNIRIEYRGEDGHYDRLPSLAAELASLGVAVIVCAGTPAAFAAKAASTTIPIVFLSGADPVKLGLVESLRRPGRNLSGVNVLLSLVGPKRLEVLHEVVPTVSTIVFLVNRGNPQNLADEPDIQAAADTLGLHLKVLTVSTEDDLEQAFASMIQHGAGALLVHPDPFLIARREQLIAQAARHALPAMYPLREYVEIGGLMSYGSPVSDLYYQLGMHTGKILRGANPADLPVYQTTKFELVINLKTAKTLGVTVPPGLLARADEVIE
jgi:putative tryptophan/tyrosine transport system substrate-binding protein